MFLHPRVRLTIVVLIVTVAPGVRSTWVFSNVDVLEKEKTFFGALSRGFSTIMVPDSISSSMNSLSVLSSSVDEVVEVPLDSLLFLAAFVSILTRAARTSAGREVQASSIEGDKVGAVILEASSL